MAKYEPKTCIRCKHRVFTKIYIKERKSHYYCWENPEIRDSSDGTRKYKIARDVSGRHFKCDKYEMRQQ